MARYAMRRLLAGAIVVLMLTFLTFMMINAAPGSTLIAILSEGPGGGAPTPAQLEAFEREVGLDKPVLERYTSWLGDLVTGDMGRSIVTNDSVWKEIQDRIPVSLELMMLSMTVALIFAIPIGVYSAVRQGGLLDYGARVFAVLGLAVPTFWLGVIVLVFFTDWTGISLATLDPPYIWNGVISNLQAYIAPALVLGFSLMAVTMRMTRSTVLDVLHEDYVRTACCGTR
jgi:peptide/nickel transport system permease protein